MLWVIFVIFNGVLLVLNNLIVELFNILLILIFWFVRFVLYVIELLLIFGGFGLILDKIVNFLVCLLLYVILIRCVDIFIIFLLGL